MEESDAELFVGTFDGVSCGVAAVRAGRITVPPAPGSQSPDPPAGATLCWFYVEPEFRGVGVGEALLAAERLVYSPGGVSDVAVLPGAQDAKSLLEQLGFTAVLRDGALPAVTGLDPSSRTRCAGIVLIEAGQLLLVQRAQQPGEGRWSLPGGRLEAGKSPEAAAVREAEEETALEVEILQLLGTALLDFAEESYEVYNFSARRRNGALCAGGDAASAGLFGPEAASTAPHRRTLRLARPPRRPQRPPRPKPLNRPKARDIGLG